jgi:hypothetical protein
LLEVTKRFGNARVDRETLEVSSELGLAIYLASIATARVRLQVSISRSPKESLGSGYPWLLAREWLDEPTRETVRRAAEQL